MSAENENPELENQNKEAEAAKVAEVNARLLAESKANKEKNKLLQAELDKIKTAQLEEQGNYKSLLEEEKKKREELEKNLSSSNQKTLKANVKATIARFASDVVDLDDLMNQPKFKKIIEEGIDGDELTLSDDAAEKYVKAVLEAKPHLKKAATPPGTHKGGKPSYNGGAQEVSYKELSAKEKTELKFKLISEKK